MSHTAERQALAAAALAMTQSGLSPGRSGNISVRVANSVLITPSGRGGDEITPGDLVELALDGTVIAGHLAPSSEWPMHLAVYQARPDLTAIVHAHSPFATALACTGRDIPPFHYMVAAAGGSRIPLAPYATFGSEELAAGAAALLRDVNACLLAHHGQIAGGTSLARAFDLAREVEALAQQYVTVLSIGTPLLLDAAEMARVIAKFRNYGGQ